MCSARAGGGGEQERSYGAAERSQGVKFDEDDAWASLKAEVEKLIQGVQGVLGFETRLNKKIEGLEKLIDEKEEKIQRLKKLIDERREEIQRLKKEMDEQMDEKDKQIQVLRRDLNKEVDLGNKVRRRVALGLAQVELESSLGKVRPRDEAWSQYFTCLTPEEWGILQIHAPKVKELLVDGAYTLNDAVDKLPADEVVGNILCIPPGQLRDAWDDIFFYAFRQHTTEFE